MARVVSLWFPTLATDRLRFGPTDRPRRDHAAPADGPLVTALAQQGRRVVAACSGEATAAGIRLGQPIAEARVLVPGLAVVEAEPDADAALLRRLSIHVARRWTPLVTVDGADGLLLDIAASAHLFGGEAALLRRIAAFARRGGLALRAAVAESAGAAWGIARHARKPVTLVPEGHDARAVASLPPAALRLEERTVDALHRLGFDTVGALLAAPRAPLVRRFGGAFGRRLEQIVGARAEPIAPLVPPGIPHARRSLLEPISTESAIAVVIEDLVGDLCGMMEERQCGVRQLLLVCRRVDARDETVTVGLARPSRAPAHLADLLRRRIETIDPGFGIETMILAAIRSQTLLPEQGRQPLGRPPHRDTTNIVAFPGAAPPDPGSEEEPDLAALVDRLANRFGAPAIHRCAPAESDVPARMVARTAPLAPADGADWRADWPRPVRLLHRPEATDHFLADLPDHAPWTFTWRGARLRVLAADGPERLYGEWWRGDGRHAVRDYFQVEVEGGARYWLFRRGDGHDPATGPGDWFVHGAFG